MEHQRDLQDIQEKFNRHMLQVNKDSMSSVPFDLSKVYPETDDLARLTGQVDDLKKCLDSFRPLDPAHLKNLEEAFGVRYTYDSNRIEGNTLTLQETALVIEKRLTVGGKSLREHLEAVNHYEALKLIKNIAACGEDLTEQSLLDIHKTILTVIDAFSCGKYRTEEVWITGSRHKPPRPNDVPKLMRDYFDYYEQEKERQHPVLLAANLHQKLVTIHPFIDGNGRTARLIMNLILLRHGFTIANLSGDLPERMKYYKALEKSNLENDLSDFHRLIFKTEKASLVEHVNMCTPNVEAGKGIYFLKKIEPFLQG